MTEQKEISPWVTIPRSKDKLNFLLKSLPMSLGAALPAEYPGFRDQTKLSMGLGIGDSLLTTWIRGSESNGLPPNRFRANIDKALAILYGFAPPDIAVEDQEGWLRWMSEHWPGWHEGPERQDSNTEAFEQLYEQTLRRGDITFNGDDTRLSELLDKTEAGGVKHRSAVKTAKPIAAIPSKALVEELVRHAGAVRLTCEKIAGDLSRDNIFPNEYRTVFADALDRLMRVLGKPRELWVVLDIESLEEAWKDIESLFVGGPKDPAAELFDAGEMAPLFDLLTGIMENNSTDPGHTIVLDNELHPLLNEMLEKIETALSGDEPENRRVALENLRFCIKRSFRELRLELAPLSARANSLQREGPQHFTRIKRLIAYAFGLRLDLAPPLACFADSLEDWCPLMVMVPTGKFVMGSGEDDPDATESEKPAHKVNIGRRFAIGRFPVTFEEYDIYCSVSGKKVPEDEGWGRGRRPVINVSWHDAHDYVRWFNERMGGDDNASYRLPGEAEWEYACRARTLTRYPWGDEWDAGMANGGRELKRTSEVGAYAANGFGLHDMIGNTYEWCEDGWEDDYKQTRTQVLIQGNESSDRVLRGGSWDNGPRDLRSAGRDRFNPEYRNGIIGFRLSRTLVTS